MVPCLLTVEMEYHFSEVDRPHSRSPIQEWYTGSQSRQHWFMLKIIPLLVLILVGAFPSLWSRQP